MKNQVIFIFPKLIRNLAFYTRVANPFSLSFSLLHTAKNLNKHRQHNVLNLNVPLEDTKKNKFSFYNNHGKHTDTSSSEINVAEASLY